MNIKHFDKKLAQPAHEGTILADDVLPEGMKAPFDHAWGYLENNSKMEGHSHPHEEIYIVIRGEGLVHVGEETEKIIPGDVIEIPADEYHTMSCRDGGPLLWAALWW